ncbi:hypothetical protein [Nitrosomonas sp.]|uniref:hypothetical protein n=1 Tax=Nitrosomonas sp. TaxID=42353 RepID=UPI00374DAF3D
MSTNNQDTNSEGLISSDSWTSIREWAKANWVWVAAHIFNLLFALMLFLKVQKESGESSTPILPVVIFMCLIFIQLYTDPIESLPAEGLNQDERKKIEDKRSQQRNKWMIFAYSFMLLSLLLTFYPFINPLFSSNTQPHAESNKQNTTTSDAKQYLKTLRERPIAVFVGCTLDPKAKNLLCVEPQPKQDVVAGTLTPGTAQATAAEVSAPGTKLAGAWVLNIGGYINNCVNAGNDEYGKAVTCQVSDGLLVPLYFIILALMGGSISLTRRLPELQKQAGSEHVATEKQPKLTQYEFREHLIFQMVQFISAPFLAVLAYYLIEPSNVTNSVALAFTAGFASEAILLMVRSVATKITPVNNAAPQYGAVAGVVAFSEKNNQQSLEKIEVFLSESPQIHSFTDEKGFYLLGNVPVGEHSISIKFATHVNDKAIENLKKDTVKIDRAQAIVKKNVVITAEDSVQK